MQQEQNIFLLPQVTKQTKAHSMTVFNTLTSGVCLKKIIAKTHIYFSDSESCYHFYKVTY